MKVLVTGATGFIGRHVCRHLVEAGHSIRVLARPTSQLEQLAPAQLDIYVGDVTVPESLGPALDGVQAVIHLAGVTAAARPGVYRRINAEGTRNLVEACVGRSLNRLVFLSSLAAQGPSRKGRPHQAVGSERPVNAYGRSKLEAERALAEHADQVPITILRPAIVYGPHDPELAAWARLARRRLIPVSPAVLLSFLHVDDLCRLLLDLCEPGPRPVGPFFLSEGPARTMAELADVLEQASHAEPGLRLPMPTRVLRFMAPHAERVATALGAGPLVARTLRELGGGGWACDASEARAQLGFEPKVPFHEGVSQTIRWFHRKGLL